MKRHMMILACCLGFLACAGAVAYPLVSNVLAERNQSAVIDGYEQTVEQTDTTELDEQRRAAQEYNATLASGAVESEKMVQDYDSLLNLAGDGIMGYVVIPTIGVELPIYHGDSNSVLDSGAAHLEGTSLPVGGSSTHAVISGHSGMAGQKMFTDLRQMQVGDLFYLEVLGQTLCYRVERILTVTPDNIAEIQIVPGRDYTTLLTCTPYGINTHRLLVRGERTEMPESTEPEAATEQSKTNGSTWMTEYRRGLAIGLMAAVILAFGLMAAARVIKRKMR